MDRWAILEVVALEAAIAHVATDCGRERNDVQARFVKQIEGEGINFQGRR